MKQSVKIGTPPLYIIWIHYFIKENNGFICRAKGLFIYFIKTFLLYLDLRGPRQFAAKGNIYPYNKEILDNKPGINTPPLYIVYNIAAQNGDLQKDNGLVEQIATNCVKHGRGPIKITKAVKLSSISRSVPRRKLLYLSML